MNMKFLATCLLASAISMTPALANPKLEEAVLKDIIEKTTVTAKELKNASVSKCFSGPIYEVEVRQKMGQGTSFSKALYTMKDDGINEITEPGTDAEMPELLGIVDPNFRLKTKEDGDTLIKAMRALFESTFEAHEVEAHFVQKGTSWSLVTGKFFKDFSGYVFETNADGQITKISRSLGIEK